MLQGMFHCAPRMQDTWCTVHDETGSTRKRNLLPMKCYSRTAAEPQRSWLLSSCRGSGATPCSYPALGVVKAFLCTVLAYGL